MRVEMTKPRPKLKSRDKKIIRFRILDGKSREETAEELGIVPITVTRAMKSTEGQKYAEKLDVEREKRHMDAYGKALDVAMDAVEGCLKELARLARESVNERVRRDACRDIAFIAGLKPREAEATGKSQKLVIEEKPKKETKSA